uniref:Polyprotein, putative n=1 Tax=Solanum demissum TaxID=50514 RepID=Q6L3R2_SOLDE|nr:Polyprotein, putative [Solanum demissum]
MEVLERRFLEREILDSFTSAIHAHGPMDRGWIDTPSCLSVGGGCSLSTWGMTQDPHLRGVGPSTGHRWPSVGHTYLADFLASRQPWGLDFRIPLKDPCFLGCYKGRLCVSDIDGLREYVLEEAHGSRYSTHSGATKMYHDLWEVYWWNGMKKKIAGFVVKCPNCQQVKAKHLRPGGLSQYIDIPTWKWEDMNMDFVVGLPRTRRQHDFIWVIINRMKKSAQFIPIKVSFSAEDYAKLYIKEVVKFHGVPLSIISHRGTRITSHFWKAFQKGLDTNVKLSTAFHPQTDGQEDRTIKTLEGMLKAERLKTAQCRQKSYADVRRRDLELEIGDWVFLKISPMKGVMRFGKKGKLSPQYVGPYQILKRIGKVFYELDLPNEFAPVHPVFHVSMLKKCIGDPVTIIPLEGLVVDESLSYKEISVEILYRKVKRLRNKEVASVKVLWRNHLVEGATWEAEADMKPSSFSFYSYPCLRRSFRVEMRFIRVKAKGQVPRQRGQAKTKGQGYPSLSTLPHPS